MRQDISGALRARDRMLWIAEDQNLAGDVKLFAFCLLAYLLETPPRNRSGQSWRRKVGQKMQADGTGPYGSPVWLVAKAIAADAPRYEVPAAEDLRCLSPKARGPHAGEPCGRKVAGRITLVDRDPLTGVARRIGYCRNHAHPSLDDWRRARVQAWCDNGSPEPAPNTGGHLPPHFGEGRWPQIYSWATWAAAHPSSIGDSDDEAHQRPSLTVIDGGRPYVEEEGDLALQPSPVDLRLTPTEPS